MTLKKGDLVRLKSPRHKDTLENEWYCMNWELMTPMVLIGARNRNVIGVSGFCEVLHPDGSIHVVWYDYLTTRMRRVKA